jgi:hypothetical protein
MKKNLSQNESLSKRISLKKNLSQKESLSKRISLKKNLSQKESLSKRISLKKNLSQKVYLYGAEMCAMEGGRGDEVGKTDRRIFWVDYYHSCQIMQRRPQVFYI